VTIFRPTYPLQTPSQPKSLRDLFSYPSLYFLGRGKKAVPLGSLFKLVLPSSIQQKRSKCTYLGLIHTRYFGTQYFDKKIKRYCNKKIKRYCNKKIKIYFFLSKYCSNISKSSLINRNKYFQFTRWKKYWLKNIFLLQYIFIFLSKYCVQKYCGWIGT